MMRQSYVLNVVYILMLLDILNYSYVHCLRDGRLKGNNFAEKKLLPDGQNSTSFADIFPFTLPFNRTNISFEYLKRLWELVQLRRKLTNDTTGNTNGNKTENITEGAGAVEAGRTVGTGAAGGETGETKIQDTETQGEEATQTRKEEQAESRTETTEGEKKNDTEGRTEQTNQQPEEGTKNNGNHAQDVLLSDQIQDELKKRIITETENITKAINGTTSSAKRYVFVIGAVEIASILLISSFVI